MSIIHTLAAKEVTIMVRVTVSRGTPAIPVPHVVNVSGVSDKNGRFDVWDAITGGLCYDDGQLTINWRDVHLPVSVRGKIDVTHSPGR